MEKIGRNDPYPCGSGKKFKVCCMNKNTTNVEPYSKTDFSEKELDKTLTQLFESHKDL